MRKPFYSAVSANPSLSLPPARACSLATEGTQEGWLVGEKGVDERLLPQGGRRGRVNCAPPPLREEKIRLTASEPAQFQELTESGPRCSIGTIIAVIMLKR